MGGIDGINTAGQKQNQTVSSFLIKDSGKDKGQCGSKTVKIGESGGSTAQLKNEIGDNLSSSGGAEDAIAKFLKKTEDLGRLIEGKLANNGRENEVLAFKSLLSREINCRASEWIDSLVTFSAGGKGTVELEKRSNEVVDELKAMVDQAFEDMTNGKIETEPAGKTPPLKEASTVYRDRAATALGTDPNKTYVYDNIGGGSCFFHAALQQLTKSNSERYPIGNTRDSANELRQALIKHTHDLKDSLDGGRAIGLKTATTYSNTGNHEVTHVFARTAEQTDIDHMHPITEGFDLALNKVFAGYSKMADVSTAALLADYLQRPVTIVAQSGDGTTPGSVNKMEFHYGLGSGRKLEGDPLLIYYDEKCAHFMAVEVKK